MKHIKKYYNVINNLILGKEIRILFEDPTVKDNIELKNVDNIKNTKEQLDKLKKRLNTDANNTYALKDAKDKNNDNKSDTEVEMEDIIAYKTEIEKANTDLGNYINNPKLKYEAENKLKNIEKTLNQVEKMSPIFSAIIETIDKHAKLLETSTERFKDLYNIQLNQIELKTFKYKKDTKAPTEEYHVDRFLYFFDSTHGREAKKITINDNKNIYSNLLQAMTKKAPNSLTQIQEQDITKEGLNAFIHIVNVLQTENGELPEIKKVDGKTGITLDSLKNSIDETEWTAIVTYYKDKNLPDTTTPSPKSSTPGVEAGAAVLTFSGIYTESTKELNVTAYNEALNNKNFTDCPVKKALQTLGIKESSSQQDKIVAGIIVEALGKYPDVSKIPTELTLALLFKERPGYEKMKNDTEIIENLKIEAASEITNQANEKTKIATSKVVDTVAGFLPEKFKGQAKSWVEMLMKFKFFRKIIIDWGLATKEELEGYESDLKKLGARDEALKTPIGNEVKNNNKWKKNIKDMIMDDSGTTALSTLKSKLEITSIYPNDPKATNMVLQDIAYRFNEKLLNTDMVKEDSLSKDNNSMNSITLKTNSPKDAALIAHYYESHEEKGKMSNVISNIKKAFTNSNAVPASTENISNKLKNLSESDPYGEYKKYDGQDFPLVATTNESNTVTISWMNFETVEDIKKAEEEAAKEKTTTPSGGIKDDTKNKTNAQPSNDK